jgi:hypothetical protein
MLTVIWIQFLPFLLNEARFQITFPRLTANNPLISIMTNFGVCVVFFIANYHDIVSRAYDQSNIRIEYLKILNK